MLPLGFVQKKQVISLYNELEEFSKYVNFAILWVDLFCDFYNRLMKGAA